MARQLTKPFVQLMMSFGAVALLFGLYLEVGTNWLEQSSQNELVGELTGTPGADLDDATSGKVIEAGPALAGVQAGDPIGVFRIDPDDNQAGVDVRKVFVEGTDTGDLQKGPGHYTGFPFPGQPGNAPIAGHRVTYGAPFNAIDELVPGDRVKVTTSQGEATYEVIPALTGAPEDAPVPIEVGEAYWVTVPEDSSSLGDYGDDRLTMTACHPKHSDRYRIIVQAKLVSPPTPGAVGQPAAESPARTEIADPDTGWADNWRELGLLSLLVFCNLVVVGYVGGMIGRWVWALRVADTALIGFVLWEVFQGLA